jgi:hypothetical protein
MKEMLKKSSNQRKNDKQEKQTLSLKDLKNDENQMNFHFMI